MIKNRPSQRPSSHVSLAGGLRHAAENLFNVSFTGWQEAWLAESTEPLLIVCPNKRFQLMSPQPEHICITHSNKSDRAERCSTELLHHATGQGRTHTHTHICRKAPTDTYCTCMCEHTHRKIGYFIKQIIKIKSVLKFPERNNSLSKLLEHHTGDMLGRCLACVHVLTAESWPYTVRKDAAVRGTQRYLQKMSQNQEPRQLDFQPSLHMHAPRLMLRSL